MTYNPGQFKEIIPFVQTPPQCLILGGPADGDEAQCAVAHWPGLKVVGVEPLVEHCEWQWANGWPGRFLLNRALSDVCGTADLRVPTENTRGASLSLGRPGAVRSIATVTLDSLDRVYGPFTNAILWMDIEGHELQALRGAKQLLEAGCIALINLEEIERLQDEAAAIRELLTGYGFELVHTWNKQPGLCCDRVYRRKTP